MGNLKIRYRLILICTLISVIPILILGTWSFYKTRTLLKTQALESIISRTEQMHIALEREVEEVNRAVGTFAYSTNTVTLLNKEYTDKTELQNMLKEYLMPTVNMIINQNENIQSILFYTSNKMPAYGPIVWPLRDLDVNPDPGDVKPYWSVSKDGIRVYQRFGQLTGSKATNLIYAQIDAQRLLQHMEIQKTDVVVFSEAGEILKSTGYGEDMLMRMLSGFSRNGYMRFEGKEYIVTNIELSGPNLRIYYITPLTNVILDSDNILQTTLVLSLAVGLLCMVVGVLFSSGLSVQFDKLIRAFASVEAGSFDIHLNNRNADEIGELMRRFEHLTGRLRQEIEEKEAANTKEREAELRTLQAQINPHFLYNTLSMINWKALECGADELSETVLTLSTFYRTALSKGSDIVTLEQELTNVKAYISIRLFMSNNGFDVEYDVDEDAGSCGVIKLLLQPIVENAIDHGIENCDGRRGRLRITVKRVENSLYIEVADNGVGMSPEQCESILSEASDGYGLKNVNSRLQFYFGKDCGLHIESVVGKGTVVSIRGIPVNRPNSEKK